MSEELIALVSCPPGKGQEIGRILVESGLAACINLLSGVRSIYLWKGKVEDDSEELLLAKTHADRWTEFENKVKEIHPYELPEIIHIKIEGGYAPYLDWLRSSVLLKD